MPSTVAQLAVQVTSNTQQAQQAILGLAAVMKSTGLEALAFVAAVAGIGALGGISIKMAGDFQSGMVTLVTGAGLAKNSLNQVSNGILQMAIDTGTSTKQLTDGMFMISSAFSSTGMSATNQLKILQAAAEGAKVGNADLMTVADAVTTVMKDYAQKNITAAQATNLLIATVAAGKTHMEDLASSISTVLPAASKFGVQLGDVMGALATMTSHGIAAANAATYLRQMIVSLAAPTTAGVKALASVGLTAQQVSDEMKISLPATLKMITDAINRTFPPGSTAANTAFKEIAGGSRQMMGMLALTGSSMGEFKADALAMGAQVHSTSTAITGWDMVQGTFNQHMDVLGATVNVLMIELGQKLLPVATQFVGWITGSAIPAITHFITMIQGTSAEAQKIRPILIVLGLAIGGALVAAFVAWTASAVAAAAATIAATWPVLAIGAAIALLIAGLIYAYKNWGWFRDAVTGAKVVLGDIISFIGGTVLPLLGKLASFIGSTVGTSFKYLGTNIKGVTSFFGSLIAGVNAAIATFGRLVGAIGAAVNAAKNAVGGVLSHIPGFASGGTMPVSGLAVVGEAGPELLQLPGGTQITPLSGSHQIQGPPQNVVGGFGGNFGGASGAPMVIQMHLDGKLVAQVVTKYQPGIIRLATGTRSF